MIVVLENAKTPSVDYNFVLNWVHFRFTIKSRCRSELQGSAQLFAIAQYAILVFVKFGKKSMVIVKKNKKFGNYDFGVGH